jgi:hypothetical protein
VTVLKNGQKAIEEFYNGPSVVNKIIAELYDNTEGNENCHAG